MLTYWPNKLVVKAVMYRPPINASIEHPQYYWSVQLLILLFYGDSKEGEK